MSYLILGSNSFSGASFINFLLEQNISNIFAVSRSDEYDKVLLSYKNNLNYMRVKFYKININDETQKLVELIYDYKIKYIINFSAQGMVSQSWNSPEQWFNTNTLALVKLLDKIHKFDFIKKFIQISTPEVYGNCNNISESMCLAPTSPYAASKASADLILHSYFKTHNFPVNFTRASNVFGAYQQLYRIIPKTILSIKKGNKLQLQGGGKALRNFIHIDDVSKMIFTIIHKAKSGEIYHLTSNKLISIYDLVKMISEELKVYMEDVVKIVDDRISQDSLYFMNGNKIKEEFSLEAQVDLKSGIKGVISWIEKDFDELIKYPDYYIHKI